MTDSVSRACPLCNSSKKSVFMKVNAYNNRDHVQLLKCSDCGFVYSETVCCNYTSYSIPTSKQSCEALDSASISQGIPELATEIIDKISVKRGRVLDYGCGAGLMLRVFKEYGYEVLGVEESEAFRKILKKDNIPSIASLSEIDDLRESFDLVIVKDVIEHLENPVEAINEIVSFIKPGGFIYVRVPNRYAYPFHWAVDTVEHVNHFTPSALKNVMKNSRMKMHGDVKIYDISSRAGRVYDSIFWKLRYFLPMTHQISLIFKKSA